MIGTPDRRAPIGVYLVREIRDLGSLDAQGKTQVGMPVGRPTVDQRARFVNWRQRLHTRGTWLALLAMLAGSTGCHTRLAKFNGGGLPDPSRLLATTSTELDMPAAPTPSSSDLLLVAPPRTLRSTDPVEYWDLTLDEAMQTALTTGKVLRDLGGQVVTAPSTVRTVLGPAIEETDPRFGVDAALSAYDAVFSTTGDFQKNDRAINNQFFGGGTRLLTQDLINFQSQLSKRAATGSQYSVRANTNYDANNAPGNEFPSAWTVIYEAEWRQPLLQGAGVGFNRTAGQLGIPGLYTGVAVARLNTDVGLTEFEMGLRDLVSDVENAYWDLVYAYRDLDAKTQARDSALETWRRIQALYVAGRAGGEAEKEAQAREQYFRFQEEVENAFAGTLIEGTQAGSGSTGGSFRGQGGVLVCERRLRMMMGMPPSDGRLIRPTTEPSLARASFDWDYVVQESLARRAELRRMRWMIKRYELELLASRNYLLPRFDTVALYRWRGFGDDLINSNSQGLPEFNNAYQNLTDGRFQEWQMGLEFNLPLGFRRGHAAVRNAQLRLSRERAVLREQEMQIVHAVAAAVADVDRAATIVRTNLNRRLAAQQQLASVEAAYEAEAAPLDLVLNAQRRLAEADGRYFRSLSEYAVAVKNVHFEKGSLLDYNQIYLAEGAWPGKAYADAAERSPRRRPWRLNYVMSSPPAVSAGPAPQGTLPPGEVSPVPPPPAPPTPPGPQGATAEPSETTATPRPTGSTAAQSVSVAAGLATAPAPAAGPGTPRSTMPPLLPTSQRGGPASSTVPMPMATETSAVDGNSATTAAPRPLNQLPDSSHAESVPDGSGPTASNVVPAQPVVTPVPAPNDFGNRRIVSPGAGPPTTTGGMVATTTAGALPGAPRRLPPSVPNPVQVSNPYWSAGQAVHWDGRTSAAMQPVGHVALEQVPAGSQPIPTVAAPGQSPTPPASQLPATGRAIGGGVSVPPAAPSAATAPTGGTPNVAAPAASVPAVRRASEAAHEVFRLPDQATVGADTGSDPAEVFAFPPLNQLR